MPPSRRRMSIHGSTPRSSDARDGVVEEERALDERHVLVDGERVAAALQAQRRAIRLDRRHLAHVEAQFPRQALVERGGRDDGQLRRRAWQADHRAARGDQARPEQIEHGRRQVIGIAQHAARRVRGDFADVARGRAFEQRDHRDVAGIERARELVRGDTAGSGRGPSRRSCADPASRSAGSRPDRRSARVHVEHVENLTRRRPVRPPTRLSRPRSDRAAARAARATSAGRSSASRAAAASASAVAVVLLLRDDDRA